MKNKITFIAWYGFHQRSDFIAQHLGASMHFIHYGQQGKIRHLPFRYFVQTLRTWKVLKHDNPDVIFIQNPPLVCVLVVYIYAKIHRCKYVIDSHTGAFFPPWNWFLKLHRILSRNALTTLLHNESQEKIVSAWGCHNLILDDYRGLMQGGEPFPLVSGHFNVAVAGNFKPDEPYDIVFEAIRRLPNVKFYIPGDCNRIEHSLLNKIPDNCFVTGYLPYERYLGLLKSVDVIISLTTRNHTLLSCASEAIGVGTPLITSNWPILKKRFFMGTIHIPNTVEGIEEGIRQAESNLNSLRQDILRLRVLLQEEWEQQFKTIKRLIENS